MLEYYDENIWYKKRKFNSNKKVKKAFAFLLILLIISLIFCYIKFCIVKNVLSYCKDYSSAKSLEIINKSVLFSLNDKTNYKDLVTIEKNSKEEITLISANTQNINKLSTDTVNLVKLNLESEFEKGIPTPLMAFTGIKFLTGYGNKIYFKALNVLKVNCSFNSVFLSAGINQTLHKISIKINCELKVNIFLESDNVNVEQEILISETVLIGKIPDLYLNNGVFK